jgi:predicted nucleic acid-binding protein
MRKILTYLDSGVLIAASRGIDLVSLKAISILDDPQRLFSSSLFVRLEILTKAKYHKKEDAINFYETFFASCQVWARDLNTIIELAENLAIKYGLNALDALQIASAISVNSDEFITTEKTTKPLHRVTEIKIISIIVFGMS